MSRLKVMLRGALISEIELKNDKEYMGGRKEGCDIRLQAEKGISREHFKLKYVDGRWQVQAVSRFGDVFSLGQKLENSNLDHGQSFQIPPYEFQLLDVPESEATSAKIDMNLNFEDDKTVIGAAPQVPYIKVIKSNGDIREMLRLEVGEVWVAGRDPSCQIVIPDQRVSRRQYEIHKLNGNYTIIDLASVNGTFLNGSPVSSTDPQTLKSGDVITVLDNTMYFELHDPNFKYKVDKIEIPPINYDPGIDENQNLDAVLPVEIPMIQQDQMNPQLDVNGGPFTGMPPHPDSNQFYTFTNPQAPAEEKISGFKKFTNNKPLVAVVVLLFLGAAFYLGDLLDQSDKKPIATQVVNENDPFTKLTPEQQNQVKEFYALAQQMMTQQKYDLALEKINRIHDLLKDGYKESKQMEVEADQNIKTYVQQKLDEEALKQKEENLKLIAQIAAKCEKLLTPSITVEQMRDCLTPMSQIDVTAPEYVKLTAEAEKLEKERQVKEAEAKLKNEELQQLSELFASAEKSQNEGLAFKAIKQYRSVVESNLSDPKKLKSKAQARIQFIKEKIGDKSVKGIAQAETLFQEGKLKLAINSLRESLIYDPENAKIKDKIEAYTEELRRQARVLYQESIIDESYGVVDSTDTKQGAKDKWKKITEIDIDDGEYYRKAVIKLRRYGVF